MAVFNSISIQDNFASVLTIDKKQNSFVILKEEVLETSELESYVIDKKNFYISATQDDVLDEQVTILSVIKNDVVLRTMILSKLKDALSSNDVLLNYIKLSENEAHETTTYQVNGVYEKEYLKTFKYFKNINEIKTATISRYALFALSQECIKAENYLSIYTQSNKIMILAVEGNNLIGYVRASSVVVDNPLLRREAMISEINRTIAYISQQFREIGFSTIALSGSIAVDDMACEQITVMTNIPVCVLYPNTIFKGLPEEEAQHYILALGNYFVPKSLQFMPSFIIGAKQYLLGLRASLVLSIFTFFATFYFAYDAYSQYEDTLSKYETIKTRLINLIENTDTYSDSILQKSWAHLEIAEKYLQYHPSDTFLLLKPLIKLNKPESVEWKYENENPVFKITFKKQFSSLESLHSFEKEFNGIFNDINSSSMQNTDESNYVTLEFKRTISTQETKQKAQDSNRRRRL